MVVQTKSIDGDLRKGSGLVVRLMERYGPPVREEHRSDQCVFFEFTSESGIVSLWSTVVAIGVWRYHIRSTATVQDSGLERIK